MGLLDVHARSWHAPSRTEQIQKAELHRLEDAEYEKKRQIKHEIETLRKVEEMQRDAAHANRELLQVANQAQRRRAVSGIDDRQRLAILEREREARARNNPNTSALLHAAAASPAHLGVPGSPMYHGTPSLGIAPSPRVRAVSHHGPQLPGSPADPLARERLAAASAIGTPRVRTVSSGMSPATIERMRLEERKRALMQREAALQHERENRLRAQKSALQLADQERHHRERERELQEGSMLNARNDILNREEVRLHAQERELHAEDDIERRLRNLSVNSPGMPSLGHSRQLSSPLAVPMEAGGMLSGLSASSPLLGHSRSRSHGGSPLMGSLPVVGSSPRLGSMGLDDDMIREAARLGIPLGSSGGLGGFGSPSMGYGAGALGVGDRSALLNHAGVSPRLASYPDGLGSDPYGGLGAAGGSLGRRGSIGSLNGYGDLGGPRSRRGSLSGDAIGGFDAYGDARGRRDSLPFDERPLFDTRGY